MFLRWSLPEVIAWVAGLSAIAFLLYRGKKPISTLEDDDGQKRLAAVAGAMISAALLRDDHFHLDFLERELVVDQLKKPERALVRHLVAAKLDSRGFAGQL